MPNFFSKFYWRRRASVRQRRTEPRSQKGFVTLYLNSEIPGVVVSLYSNRLIKGLASGLLGLFLPVFLYQIYDSINFVLLYYGLIYFLYLLFAAPGAMIATRLSFRRSMMLSIVFGIVTYVGLIYIESNVFLITSLLIITGTIERALYWVPFHSGVGKFVDQKIRGRTLSLFSSVGSLMTIVLPVAAGFIIAAYGFDVLFVIAILLYISSLIPMLTMQPINEFYTFGYIQTWKVLFHKRDRKILITYVAEGAVDFINFLIWPIFIWQLLDGNYQVVGIVASLVVLVTILLKLIMGNFTDKLDKKKLLRYGTILYSIGWLLKIFVHTASQIFVVSTYHSLSGVAMRTPFDTIRYEKSADAGHYIDEYTVMREMSLNIGRVLMAIFLFILFNFVGGLTIAFAIAAVAVLFINLI